MLVLPLTIYQKDFQLIKQIKKCSLYKCIQEKFNGDWSNFYIELYEEYSCGNKYQLNRREGEIQREIATINKNKAGRTMKEYYVDNKDYFLQYYLDNKEKRLEYQNQYNINKKIDTK